MVKFTIEKKTLLGRLGKIDTWGSVEVNHQTPSCMTYLRAGHIPHLTWEVAATQLRLEQTPIYQMTLPSLVTQAKIIEKFGKGAPKFCGIPASSAIHLTPFDPLGKLPGGYNDSKSVAIWTPNGKVSLDVKTWRSIINSFGCESFETLVDYDTPRDAGQKKLLKAVERTRTFHEQLFQQDEKVKGERIVTLGGGFSKYHRRKCAMEVGLAEETSAYSVEFREFSEGKEVDEKEIVELLEETFSPLPPTKLRYIAGPFNPKTILFLIKNGIDLFDSSFPVKLADEGHAFCLADDYPTSSNFEIVDFNNQKFADDFTTPFAGCECYTCKKYTKGYLQHLLNTHELLASILLVIHNITEYDRMFKLIRKSLENSEGI
uniref:Queuine tRNA-ribosyltransferase accessory subunit 2 n=3 Tax=Caenorhabditis tropicalis TaxID=1561998 RepID=A0A1I7T6A8_9PELO